MLLDESDHDAAAIAEAFLRNSLALSETISSQVMQSLLKHLKVDRQILSKNQFNLLDNIMSKFITSCFQCKLMYAMNAAMSSNRNNSIGNGSILRSRAMDLDSLQLGDNVEILLSTEWLVGTVVKVNSMTGELHIEHSSSGAGGGNPPLLQVSIVHRSSGQVRSLTTSSLSSSSSSSSTLAAAAHRPEQNIMRRNVVAAVNDDHHIAAVIPPLPAVHTGLGGLFPPPLEEDQQSHGNNEDLKDHAFNIKFGHNANNEIGERIMIDISLLLYGRYPYHCEGVDAKRGRRGGGGGVIALDMNTPHHMSTSIPMSIINNMGGHNDDDEIPRCENGHICLVKPIISLNNIGFICACCTKLYSMTGTNQQQPNFGRQFPELAHLVQTRYAQATHRWNCEDCNYDLCLNCFPCKSFDHHHHHADVDDAADAMFGLSSAASYKTSSSPNYNMKRYNFSYNYNNANNNKKMDDDDNAVRLKQHHHHHKGTGQRQTICLIGRLESSYCIVRDAPSHDAREISRVSVNSVIDIIDTIDSEYYQLIGSKGYVRKVLGVGWYWRTLPRERYMVYNTTEKEEDEKELESNSDDVPPPLDDIRLLKGDDHGYTREKASSHNNSSSSSSSSRPSIISSVAGSNVSAEPTLSDQSSVSYLFAMLLQNIISIDKARKNLFHVSYNSNAAAAVVVDDRQLKVQLKLSELRIEYTSLLKHALLLLTQVLIRCMLL